MDRIELLKETVKCVADSLSRSGCFVVVAESCTGGMIASELTSVPGASQWFDRGVVTYTNRSKHEILGVSEEVLEQFGAVSAECVSEMLKGALTHSQANLAVAVSGIAGPSGALPNKPVGTVYIGWMRRGEEPFVERFLFNGNRENIRLMATKVGIEGLVKSKNK